MMGATAGALAAAGAAQAGNTAEGGDAGGGAGGGAASSCGALTESCADQPCCPGLLCDTETWVCGYSYGGPCFGNSAYCGPGLDCCSPCANDPQVPGCDFICMYAPC